MTELYDTTPIEKFVVLNAQGDQLTQPVERTVAEHFAAEVNYRANRAGVKGKPCVIVPVVDVVTEAADIVAEHTGHTEVRLQLTLDEARATGVLPACFQPKDGVTFTLVIGNTQ